MAEVRAYKYRYEGTEIVEVPVLNKLVQPGDEIETSIKLNHPDFIELQDAIISQDEPGE